MSDELRQQLSSLQDDEPTPVPTLLEALASDPELRACWERYTLIGQVIRGEAIDPGMRVLADQVRSALASEPTILCPTRLRRTHRRWIGRQVGLALAASLVLIAILTVPTLLEVPLTPRAVGPVAVQLDGRPSIRLQRWQLEHPELASKLDRYLVTHQATVSVTGAKGLLPYAMLVGYEAAR
ncbi:MAG: sigma-E factor negative regulatory protein [Thermochromatium sp.]